MSPPSRAIGRQMEFSEQFGALAKRLHKQGFVLLDHRDKFRGAFLMLARWVREGKLKP